MIHNILIGNNAKSITELGSGNSLTTAKYKHTQQVESQMWIIHHNLNTLPFVLTINNEQQIFGSVYYPNNNVTYVYFNTPIKGIAYCY